jgi:integrase
MRRTPLVKDAVHEYLLLRSEQAAANTVANERGTLRRFARATPMQIGHVTPKHVERFFFDPAVGIVHNHRDAARRGRMAQSSVNKVRSHLAQFFEFCRGRRWLSGDPLINVVARTPVERQKARLTRRQLLLVLEAARDPRDRVLIAIALNTALRASEITGLRLRDVDLDAGSLHVYIPKVRRTADMPITPHLDGELRRWQATYSAAVATTPECFLVPSRRSNGRDTLYLPTQQVTKPAALVQRAMKDVGITDVWQEGVHCIRRSVARLAFDQWSAGGYDNSLRLTMALLNHRDSKVTERYLGIAPDLLKRDTDMRAGFLFEEADVPRVPARRLFIEDADT